MSVSFPDPPKIAVVAGAATQVVVTRPAVDQVVPAVSQKRVIPRLAEHPVVAGAAVDEVVAEAGLDNVVAAIGEDDVVVRTRAGDHGVAVVDPVALGIAPIFRIDRVVAGSALDGPSRHPVTPSRRGRGVRRSAALFPASRVPRPMSRHSCPGRDAATPATRIGLVRRAFPPGRCAERHAHGPPQCCASFRSTRHGYRRVRVEQREKCRAWLQEGRDAAAPRATHGPPGASAVKLLQRISLDPADAVAVRSRPMPETGPKPDQAVPAARQAGQGVVPAERLELSRCCHRRILNPLRLPFRHAGTWIRSSAGRAGNRRQVTGGRRRTCRRLAMSAVAVAARNQRSAVRRCRG